MNQDYRIGFIGEAKGKLEVYNRQEMQWQVAETKGNKFAQKVKQQLKTKRLLEVTASLNDNIANFQTEKKSWSVNL